MALALPVVLAGPAPSCAFPNIGSQFGETVREKLELPRKPEAFKGLDFGILGSYEFDAPKHRFASRWRKVLERAGKEADYYSRCGTDKAQCSPGLREWRNLIAGLKDLPQELQLERLNAAINRMATYADDGQTFGKADHWATPLEFLEGRADCEDYATIKFLSLLELGYRDDQMRIAIVRDTRRNIMHAVVTVDLGDKQVILDNLFDHVIEQRHILKYAPLFSANLSGQFGHIVSKQLRIAYLNRLDGRDTAQVGDAAANGQEMHIRLDTADWT